MEKIKNYFKDKNVQKGLLSIFFYFAMMEGLSAILALVLKAIFSKGTIENHLTAFNIFFEAFIYIPLFIGIFFINRIKVYDDFRESRRDTKKLGGDISIAIIIMYAASFLGSVLSSVLEAPSSANQEAIDDMIKSGIVGTLEMIIIGGILGPIIEELIFRRSFFAVLKNKYAAIIVSSLVFGMMHVWSQDVSWAQRFAVGIPYISMGVALGYIYEKSDRNIIVPIAGHMLNNLFACLLTILMSIAA